MKREYVQVDDDVFVLPEHIAVVKRNSADACTIFTPGQLATDGFVVRQSAESLIADLESEPEDEE